MNTLSVTVADGKYTVQQDEFGRLSALRYGEQWRDLLGDGLVLALAQEVDKLRDHCKIQSELMLQELSYETQAEEAFQKLLAAEKVIAELRQEVAELKQTIYDRNLDGWEAETYD